MSVFNKYIKKNVDGHIMYLFVHDSGISSVLKVSARRVKTREQAFMSIIRKEVVAGMTVCDVGANIGFVTLLLCRLVGKKGKVYAIEPDPNNVKLLRRNIEVNGYKDRVEIIEGCFSDRSGKIDFNLSDKFSNLGSVKHTKHSSSKIRVPSFTIDTFFAKKRGPDFIKMDVEGHEIEIIDGALKELKRVTSTKLLIEIHPGLYDDPKAMEKRVVKLVSLGFSVKYIVTAGVRIPSLLKNRGYNKPDLSLKKYGLSDDYRRAVYSNVKNADAAYFCRPHKLWVPRKRKFGTKVLRSIMLVK